MVPRAAVGAMASSKGGLFEILEMSTSKRRKAENRITILIEGRYGLRRLAFAELGSCGDLRIVVRTSELFHGQHIDSSKSFIKNSYYSIHQSNQHRFGKNLIKHTIVFANKVVEEGRSWTDIKKTDNFAYLFTRRFAKSQHRDDFFDVGVRDLKLGVIDESNFTLVVSVFISSQTKVCAPPEMAGTQIMTAIIGEWALHLIWSFNPIPSDSRSEVNSCGGESRIGLGDYLLNTFNSSQICIDLHREMHRNLFYRYLSYLTIKKVDADYVEILSYRHDLFPVGNLDTNELKLMSTNLWSRLPLSFRSRLGDA